MAWVYLLRGDSGRYSIGSTTDLPRRLDQHRPGHTHSTRRLGMPLEVAAALELDSLTEARSLERELKRKKNPRLALFLMQQRQGRQLGQSSPERIRGWS
jgi:predicted GIY-YIG superfamily endonuclease